MPFSFSSFFATVYLPFFTSHVRKLKSGFSWGRLGIFIQLWAVVLCWLLLGKTRHLPSTSETSFIFRHRKTFTTCLAAVSATGCVLFGTSVWGQQGGFAVCAGAEGRYMESTVPEVGVWRSTLHPHSLSMSLVIKVVSPFQKLGWYSDMNPLSAYVWVNIKINWNMFVQGV